MGNKTLLKQQLLDLLPKKRGKSYYADKLGVSIEDINELLEEINPTGKVKNEDNIQIPTNTINIIGYYTYPPKPEDVIRDHKIDTTKWKLASYWSKQKTDGKWQISALFCPLKFTQEDFSLKFQDFLKDYKPKSVVTSKVKKQKTNLNTCLIINKQDAHYNKFSIDGNNNMQDRFDGVYNKTTKILEKATVSSNLSKTVYILGSDLFNSENTGFTTHGTPQQNIGTFEKSFEEICTHEISMIDLILSYTDNIEILYIRGNHDSNVGWHLVNWLKVYYRNNKNVNINTDTTFTKYVKFSNTAMMFNHGYKVKPEQLASKFPMEFKEWSSCDNYYIFCGDLHRELSKDMGGIMFFRLSQMSSAMSEWDDEKGFTKSRGEMTAFLIEENNGITDTYREIL